MLPIFPPDGVFSCYSPFLLSEVSAALLGKLRICHDDDAAAGREKERQLVVQSAVGWRGDRERTC